MPLVLSDNERIYNSHLSYGGVKEETVCKTLTAQMDNQTDMLLVPGGKDAASEGKATTPCYCLNDHGGERIDVELDRTCTLRAETHRHEQIVVNLSHVRRLTPVECERLQGFPDNWTQIPYRGKAKESCPDAPRYKAIGNSWAVPVVRWLGQRIKDSME